jgi:N-acetyl-anhydromuramyl-L-alanine amidase AmpD
MIRTGSDTDNAHGAINPPTLRRGDTGIWVDRLQRLLKRHGYDVSCCGVFGPVTEIALRSFQHLHHLPVNGVTDTSTWLQLIEK